MGKILFQITIMILVASVTVAVGFQGEVIKIEGEQITIEVFGDEMARFRAGNHVSLDPIPKGAPTLDMLQG